MKKIYFPHYKNGEFDSLREAVLYVGHHLESYLINIVRYNIQYRDYLRKNGVEALISHLIDEVPELANKQECLDALRESLDRCPISDFDIQCYNINDKVNIMGHTFNGLNDIIESYECSAWDSITEIRFMPLQHKSIKGIHIAKISQPYPKFDSSDRMYDHRSYRNYFFRTKPFTSAEDFKEYFKCSHQFNFCFVNDALPEKLLPAVYYGDDSNYMLVATKKKKNLFSWINKIWHL